MSLVRSHPIYASVYDRYNRGAEESWLGACRRHIAEKARGRVLDIGAGTGMNLLYYAAVDEVIAAEPDAAYLRQLRRRAPFARVPVTVVEARAEHLPFPDASFDTIVSTLVLCSVDDPGRCARELRRVVKPDGQLLLLEHVRTDGGRFARIAQDAAVPIWRFFVGGCRCNRPTLATVEAAGFVFEERHPFHPRNVPFVMYPFVAATARPD